MAADQPAYSIHVGRGLYLDNDNVFHSAPIAGAPVYELGGGLLSLSTQTRDGLLSGHIAVLPLKDEPSWKAKLRKLNVSEDSIELFGKAASLIGDVVTIIGWAQAAYKIGQWLKIFEQGKSVEQLAAEILAGVETLQSMQVEGQEHNVKAMLDTSRGQIAASHRQARGSSLGKPFLDKNSGGGLDLAERKRRRLNLLEKVEDIDGQLGEILSGTRWELFLHPDHYLWGGRSPGAPARTFKNAPWWRMPIIPELKYLADDRTWVDVNYPPAFKLRFDYRAALPHALYGVMAYVTTLKLAEPEFRSTGLGRESLLAHADALAGIMQQMRAVLARTHVEASDLRLSEGGYPSRDPRRLHVQCAVGAIDLCAHTQSYFDQQAQASGRPSEYRLGVLDFDWKPPNADITWVPLGYGYWAFVDSHAAVEAANRQAEQDHTLLLQLSGYFQLAQMEASLRHLATDPDTSETVTGTVRRTRRRTGERSVGVVGDYGIMCAPERVTSTGTLEEHRCQATVGLSLQPKDRTTGLLPVRVLLVSLDAPPDAPHFNVRAEQEIWPRLVDSVELDAVSTFDWYVETLSLDELVRPVDRHLDLLASRRTVSYASQTFSTGSRNLSEVPDRVWFDIDLFVPNDTLPSGERRNVKSERVTFDVAVTDTSAKAERSLQVRVVSKPDTRNVDLVYVVVEETLASRRKLRTYFDVHMNTQLTYLPRSFFKAERECLEAATRVVDHIERNYSKSKWNLRPDVPVTLDQFQQHVRRLEAEAPDVLRRAILEVGQR